MGYTRVVSHPEIVGFQKIIRKKSIIMIFFIIINFSNIYFIYRKSGVGK